MGGWGIFQFNWRGVSTWRNIPSFALVIVSGGGMEQAAIQNRAGTVTLLYISRQELRVGWFRIEGSQRLSVHSHRLSDNSASSLWWSSSLNSELTIPERAPQIGVILNYARATLQPCSGDQNCDSWTELSFLLIAETTYRTNSATRSFVCWTNSSYSFAKFPLKRIPVGDIHCVIRF